MEEIFIAYLLGSVPLTTLVGNRINWNTRPQITSMPALNLTKISAVRSYQMLGSSGLVSARVQIDCWATSFESVMEVSRAVITLLSGTRFTDGGIQFQAIFLDSERHFFEEEAAERFHRVSLDFIIWHSE